MLLRQYLEQRWSNTALADRLGISRSTVYEWIASGLGREVDDQAVRYRARPPVARKIDDYRGIVQSRLEQYLALCGASSRRAATNYFLTLLSIL